MNSQAWEQKEILKRLLSILPRVFSMFLILLLEIMMKRQMELMTARLPIMVIVKRFWQLLPQQYMLSPESTRMLGFMLPVVIVRTRLYRMGITNNLIEIEED